jgi:hypothetical protein
MFLKSAASAMVLALLSVSVPAHAQQTAAKAGSATDDDNAFIKSLDGAVYVVHFAHGAIGTLEIHGHTVVAESRDPRNPGMFSRRLYDITGRKFVQERTPEDCREYFGRPNCAGEASITEKEIRMDSVVDGQDLGQRVAFDLTWKRAKHK